RNQHDRDLHACTCERPARDAAPGSDRLRYHQRPRPGPLGVARLVAEEADAAVDERDVTRAEPGELGRRAAAAREAEAARDSPRARVAQDLELPRALEPAAVHDEGGAVEPEVP